MAKLLNPIPKPCGLVKAFKLTLVVVVSLFSIARPAWFANAQVVLPTDAQPTCVVTAPVFASWFESGSVSLNGVVKPANSITFPDVPNCSFYQWSMQMFLWLTSPTPPSYGGGGGHIFDSPVFFDVSPPDSNGDRTFIPHTRGRVRDLTLRAAQVGRNGLPVIMDKRGRMFEIERPRLAPSGKQLIQIGRASCRERV